MALSSQALGRLALGCSTLGWKKKKKRGEKENYQIRTGSENTQYKEIQKDACCQVQTVLDFIVCTEVENRVVDLTVANYNNNSGQLDSTVYCQYTL